MKTVTSLTLIATFAVIAASHAEARGFGRVSTIRTERGTTTRAVAGSVTRDSASRTVVTVGPNGRTASVSQQVQRTENGRASSGVYTGPNGKTVTTNGSVTHDDGVRTATRSMTLPDGTTKSVSKTTTR